MKIKSKSKSRLHFLNLYRWFWSKCSDHGVTEYSVQRPWLLGSIVFICGGSLNHRFDFLESIPFSLIKYTIQPPWRNRIFGPKAMVAGINCFHLWRSLNHRFDFLESLPFSLIKYIIQPPWRNRIFGPKAMVAGINCFHMWRSLNHRFDFLEFLPFSLIKFTIQPPWRNRIFGPKAMVAGINCFEMWRTFEPPILFFVSLRRFCISSFSSSCNICKSHFEISSLWIDSISRFRFQDFDFKISICDMLIQST
jgi:hypothetical protein